MAIKVSDVTLQLSRLRVSEHMSPLLASINASR
jgi:hypothetical protein